MSVQASVVGCISSRLGIAELCFGRSGDGYPEIEEEEEGDSPAYKREGKRRRISYDPQGFKLRRRGAV